MKKSIFLLLIVLLVSVQTIAHHRHYHHGHYRGYHHGHYRGYMNENVAVKGMPKNAQTIQMPAAPPVPTEP